MKYIKDNPFLVKNVYYGIPINFTGVVRDEDGDIAYYLNGKLHRTDGPAIEEKFGNKEWYLNGKRYGYDDDFTNKSWIRFVKLELLK